MKVLVFSAKKYEIAFFHMAESLHELHFTDKALDISSVQEAKGFEAVCCFVIDELNAEVLTALSQQGVKLIALRCAGFDQVDRQAAKALGLTVVNVPAYSPNAIAEFTVGLMLALIRKIPHAHDLVRQHNFSLEGQLGFNLQGKTVGLVGTGRIGAVVAKILAGFECQILATDPCPSALCKDLDVRYTDVDTLFGQTDIISLHCPLNAGTRYLINERSLALMKKDVVLINTGRGGLIDTAALINRLKQGTIGAVGLDVYEKERALFFTDHSGDVILDDAFIRLQAFPNVLITGHQAYLTEEALQAIVATTLDNITAFEKGSIQNPVS